MPHPSKHFRPPRKTFRHSKLVIVSTIALVTLAFTLLDQTHLTMDRPDTKTAPSPSAALVPDATLALLDGGSISLHSLAGHTVWLHFWAAWCVPCRKEFPDLLNRLQKEDRNVILVAVSGDADALEARRFLAPMRQEFKTLFDEKRVIIAHDPTHKVIEGLFQTFQYPETIIVDSNLFMVRKIIGIYKN